MHIKMLHVSGHRILRSLWLSLCITFVSGCQPADISKSEVQASNSQVSTAQKATALERSASASGIDKMPSAGQVLSKPEVQAVDPVGVERLEDAITCLARTIYWEARGENIVSMEAVANVVMNRLGAAAFPNTVCGVVTQGKNGVCQFSWWCDGRPDHAREVASYSLAKEIARRALNQQLTDRTYGALYFHHRNVEPSWSKVYDNTVAIGEFLFYKPDAQLAMDRTEAVGNQQ